MVLCQRDNMASMAWSKSGKHSLGGQALRWLRFALMINNPIALKTTTSPCQRSSSQIPSHELAVKLTSPLPSLISNKHIQCWMDVNASSQLLSNLKNHRSNLAWQMHRSNQSKQANTNGMWKNYYLRWCSEMMI
jgi:hypothetical protein